MRDDDSVVWTDSLASFKVYGSQTPSAFADKALQFPPSQLLETSTIFADILRATTTLVAVGAAGAHGVFVDVKPESGDYPFSPPERVDPAWSWVYGGELNGRPITGRNSLGEAVEAIVGNSPLSIKPGQFSGKYLRFFSTNGSRALQALTRVAPLSIHAMSFANVRKTLAAVLDLNPKRIWLTCGGFYGSASLEDSVACGLVVEMLLNEGFASEDELDDEAHCMLLFARYFVDENREFDAVRLAERLVHLQVGKLLTRIGHGSDVAACINGTGMPAGLWEDMCETTLSIAELDRPLLVVGQA